MLNHFYQLSELQVICNFELNFVMLLMKRSDFLATMEMQLDAIKNMWNYPQHALTR
jgi:hypothetical protein